MRVCRLVSKGGIGLRCNSQFTKLSELRLHAVLGEILVDAYADQFDKFLPKAQRVLDTVEWESTF